jgi:DNA-binding IscR family transcriptional regulator
MVRARRFSLATHMLLVMARGPHRPTGKQLALSTRAHPVTVRTLATRLTRTGLALARSPSPGYRLALPPEKITLRDIWLAVADADEGPAITCHPEPDETCPVGARIGSIMDRLGMQVESAVLTVLSRTTLADLLETIDPVTATGAYPAEMRAGSSVT